MREFDLSEFSPKPRCTSYPGMPNGAWLSPQRCYLPTRRPLRSEIVGPSVFGCSQDLKAVPLEVDVAMDVTCL